MRRVTPQSLGGQISPKILIGHLCQTCDDAVAHTGSLGPSAMERALIMALVPEGVGKLAYDNFSMNGLVGWGVLSATSQASPNAEPWKHLGDLEELRRRLTPQLSTCSAHEFAG